MLECTSRFTSHHLETFLLFCSSFLLSHSGTIRCSLVALLVAALLSKWQWVKTKMPSSRSETTQHNSTVHRNENQTVSPDWLRRNTYEINLHVRTHALQIAVVIKLLHWHCQVQFQLSTDRWSGRFMSLSTYFFTIIAISPKLNTRIENQWKNISFCNGPIWVSTPDYYVDNSYQSHEILKERRNT